MERTAAVTGALGYSGRSIARILLDEGWRVRTLTNSPGKPNPFGAAIDIHPLAFHQPDRLAESLRGSDTLINTYWVRFNHRRFNFARAVENTKALFAAARAVGVRRVVHISILNPERGTGLAYYEGKLALERMLAASGLSHAILRPGVLFGGGDILINNIAWALRHLPVFGVFGDGRYPIRPIHVDDLARLAVDAAAADANTTTDAVGPEPFAFVDLVRELARILGVRRAIVRVPTGPGLAVTGALGLLVRDVVLTREEVLGLTRGLLGSAAPTTGARRLTEWAREHRDELGRHYASELGRRAASPNGRTTRP